MRKFLHCFAVALIFVAFTGHSQSYTSQKTITDPEFGCIVRTMPETNLKAVDAGIHRLGSQRI